MTAFQEALTACWDKHYSDMKNQQPTIELRVGKRFTKVMAIRPHGGGWIWGFIENATGDIYKAASLNAPAKHVRGSIYNENPMYNCGEYSPNYIVR